MQNKIIVLSSRGDLVGATCCEHSQALWMFISSFGDLDKDVLTVELFASNPKSVPRPIRE